MAVGTCDSDKNILCLVIAALSCGNLFVCCFFQYSHVLQAKEIADLQSKLDESSGKIHSLQGQVIKIQVSVVAMVTVCYNTQILIE